MGEIQSITLTLVYSATIIVILLIPFVWGWNCGKKNTQDAIIRFMNRMPVIDVTSIHFSKVRDFIESGCPKWKSPQDS